MKTGIENPLRVGLNTVKKPQTCTIVIFGGSGDLTTRKLGPALYNLFIQNHLSVNFSVVGFARRPITHEEFREKLLEGAKRFSRSLPIKKELWEKFSRNIFFFSSNFDDESGYKRLAQFLKNLNKDKGKPGNYVFYLAAPPSFFPAIVEGLGKSGLSAEYTGENGFSRVVVEKPFGSDLRSAEDLSEKFLEFFKESQIYRIDHYLGKETVQNIMVFRFANGIFEPLWNHNMIDHIQITMSEDIGIENRGGFYEKAGAIRDVVQNHIMQIISLIAMEPPINFDPESIKNEKLKVIMSIRSISPEDAHKYSLRGQYGVGWVAGKPVRGYREEERISLNSETETFVILKLFLDNWRFGGVPFYIRTGKRLAKRVTEVAIQFKKAPHTLFSQNTIFRMEPNFLILHIQPDKGISLKFNSKIPGQNMQIRPVNMDFSYGSSFGIDSPDAYERLLLDCFLGDSTLFIRADELEASWKIIDPILEGWKQYPDLSPTYPYKAGTWGPGEGTTFLEKDSRFWRRP